MKDLRDLKDLTIHDVRGVRVDLNAGNIVEGDIEIVEVAQPLQVLDLRDQVVLRDRRRRTRASGGPGRETKLG